jgi:hypothetical protein
MANFFEENAFTIAGTLLTGGLGTLAGASIDQNNKQLRKQKKATDLARMQADAKAKEDRNKSVRDSYMRRRRAQGAGMNNSASLLGTDGALERAGSLLSKEV